MVCKKSFSKLEFRRYPNGVLTHIDCAHDDTVCPVTGTVFKSKLATR